MTGKNTLGARRTPAHDPLTVFPRLATKLKTLWLKSFYAFPEFGNGTSIHHTCCVNRPGSRYVRFNNDVFLGPDVWLNIVFGEDDDSEAKIVFGKGTKVGRRCTISARRRIEFGEDVLLAPDVLVMDHNHEYSNPDLPIHAQGVTSTGKIVIGKNSWLGYGSVIFCAKGELELGRNCVVGAHSVVTKSFPAYSVVAGNPAKLIKTYDFGQKRWVRCAQENERSAEPHILVPPR